MPTRTPKLYLSGKPEADRLLARDPLALLVGMVLDQQIPLEWAFAAPLELTVRLGAPLDAVALAAMPEDELAAAFAAKPALHRFPGSMAKRVHDLTRLIVGEYGGQPAKIWKTAKTGPELLARVKALPGFGDQKAKIFVALLGKQFGVTPAGWVEACAPFGEEGSLRSIADIDSAEALAAVREHKRAMKAAAKAAAPAPKESSSAKPASSKTATKPKPAGATRR